MSQRGARPAVWVQSCMDSLALHGLCDEPGELYVQLLPLMWLALLALTLSLLAVLKWLLVNRVKATSYQKYSWAFQTKALNAAIQV